MNTKTNKMIGMTTAGIAALLLTGGILARPAAADVQDEKNAARNVGIGLGAAAIYEATQGKGTNALLLGAGAAIAGAAYEQDRKVENNGYYGGGYYDGGYRSGYRVAYREGYAPVVRENVVVVDEPRYVRNDRVVYHDDHFVRDNRVAFHDDHVVRVAAVRPEFRDRHDDGGRRW